MRLYIAKPDTWFDEGTEAQPVTGFWDCETEDGTKTKCAIFLGIRDGKPDEEGCTLEEFVIWRMAMTKNKTGGSDKI